MATGSWHQFSRSISWTLTPPSADFRQLHPERVRVAEYVGYCVVLYPTSCICRILDEMDKTERTRGDWGAGAIKWVRVLSPLNPLLPTRQLRQRF
jgi:hypothetical protein